MPASAPVRQPRSVPAWLLLAAALALTAVVYGPGLHGGFVFDDYANILQNPGVHPRSLDWQSLREAARASPSPVLARPLSMLTFAFDWYFAGGSPFEMKLVNLAIHLINGLLLFALLRRIVRAASAPAGHDGDRARADLVAVCVTAAWMLAPINFTAVAYIVQRMESLCQLFVLAGLLGYSIARERMRAGKPGFAAATLSIAFGTGIGVLAKESAALLPLYAFILEWSVFGFRSRAPGIDRRLILMYAAVLFVPGVVAGVWALRGAVAPGAWSNRPFTLGQRLLTEPRILLDYVHWSLLPNAETMSLFHDQVATSKGLFEPPTTFASIAALVVAAIAAIGARRSYPLLALGIGWFLAAHLLTGTIIPLELVFEHRNYFASIGLYLAVVPLLLPRAGRRMALARATTCVALLALFAFVTWTRSSDWSNPVELAMSEADKNPDSPRTAYELGRSYVIVSGYDKASPYVARAYETLERAAAMPGANLLPDQGLLILSGRLHEDPPPGTWQRLQQKVATQRLSAENISALHALSQCAVREGCDFPESRMVRIFSTALERFPGNPQLLSTYANYALNVLHDSALAIRLATENVRTDPHSLQARRNLLLLLHLAHRDDEALALYRRTLREIPGASEDRALTAQRRQLAQALPAASTTVRQRP